MKGYGELFRVLYSEEGVAGLKAIESVKVQFNLNNSGVGTFD